MVYLADLVFLVLLVSCKGSCRMAAMVLRSSISWFCIICCSVLRLIFRVAMISSSSGFCWV